MGVKTLLLDVGNTCLKWAVWDQGEGSALGQLEQLGPLASCRYAGEDVAMLLDGQWAGLAEVDRVLLASVGSAAFTRTLQTYLQRRWAVPMECLTTPAADWGVINAYADPQRLGIDRWLALIAARQLSSGPLWVVDCGSAVTIDRLDAEGRHQGGLILPGLAMMAQGLALGADNLSLAARVDETAGLPVELRVAQLAQDTTTAVTTGVLTMLVAAIDRIVSESAPLTGAEAGSVSAIITGGDADRIRPLLVGEWLHQPQLVLQGMALMVAAVTVQGELE